MNMVTIDCQFGGFENLLGATALGKSGGGEGGLRKRILILQPK